MSLDLLLTAVKWTDTQVLKGYTCLALSIENRNIPPEYIGILGCFLGAPTLPFPSAIECYANRDALQKKEGTSLTKNIIRSATDDLAKVARLPVLVSAAIELGYATHCSLEGFTTENESLFQFGLKGLFYGVSALGVASSMYLRDRNPQLLNKESIWKRARDYLLGKMPSPELEPQTTIILNKEESPKDL